MVPLRPDESGDTIAAAPALGPRDVEAAPPRIPARQLVGGCPAGPAAGGAGGVRPPAAPSRLSARLRPARGTVAGDRHHPPAGPEDRARSRPRRILPRGDRPGRAGRGRRQPGRGPVPARPAGVGRRRGPPDQERRSRLPHTGRLVPGGRPGGEGGPGRLAPARCLRLPPPQQQPAPRPLPQRDPDLLPGRSRRRRPRPGPGDPAPAGPQPRHHPGPDPAGQLLRPAPQHLPGRPGRAGDALQPGRGAAPLPGRETAARGQGLLPRTARLLPRRHAGVVTAADRGTGRTAQCPVGLPARRAPRRRRAGARSHVGGAADRRRPRLPGDRSCRRDRRLAPRRCRVAPPPRRRPAGLQPGRPGHSGPARHHPAIA